MDEAPPPAYADIPNIPTPSAPPEPSTEAMFIHSRAGQLPALDDEKTSTRHKQKHKHRHKHKHKHKHKDKDKHKHKDKDKNKHGYHHTHAHSHDDDHKVYDTPPTSDGFSPASSPRKKTSTSAPAKKKELSARASFQRRTSATTAEEEQLKRLKDLIDEYEISFAKQNELRELCNYKIIFICDDSGSMRSRVRHGPVNPHTGKRMTRWEELKETVSMVLELGTCFDEDGGVDVHFLNRPPVLAISTLGDHRLISAFEGPPKGFTPLSRVLTKVLKEQEPDERPILMVISTDGIPTNDLGEPDTSEFQETLEACVDRAIVPRNVYVTFLACSDDEVDVGWLNELDRCVKHVDVSDDFESEREEVLSNKNNKMKQFNRADYVVKALLGPTNEKYDNMDFDEAADTEKDVYRSSKKKGTGKSSKHHSHGHRKDRHSTKSSRRKGGQRGSVYADTGGKLYSPREAKRRRSKNKHKNHRSGVRDFDELEDSDDDDSDDYHERKRKEGNACCIVA